ncbi:unnamed protein product (macronuclear) [Paramecium tetraurelia]|uniref:Uncharacterized protein n=1 Tax=Paramecium tetraurelia TaxID=5888 RepID=A0DV02_PARTE|nr:uncharacterized protein GSPATT00020531001 [Paramecium tetraurelia]CAK86869.1 unnamed protein product [Paramecium tetraurelia]|eukprot:XP_001454266.1 hypothetical protein (macronuclear) [Paramecium tetraurelia strain d4-2]
MKSNYRNTSFGQHSISDNSDTQRDVELEDIDMSKMNHYTFYQSINAQQTQYEQIEGEIFILEVLQNIVHKTIKIAADNEINRKIPPTTATAALELIILPLTQSFNRPEDPKPDFKTGGLSEDYEPVKEQWLTANMIVEQQQPAPISRQLTTAQTLVRQKLNDQTQIKKEQKQLDPMPIDLDDPLDISITEEKLRTAKERQTLERQQLYEQEKRRKIKLEQEEQLKYEIIAKDKKSKQFTYDYDGKLIPVTTTKITKLPPSTSTLVSKFEEDTVTKLAQKKKQYNKINMIGKRNDEDKETFKFNQLAPLVIENMNLQSGVTINYEGRLKEGLKTHTIDLNNMSNPCLRMARLEYLGLTQIMNSNRNQVNSVNVKAEDKEVKQATNFNYEKLKRFTQQSHTKQGQIKINSTKIYDQLASTLFEEESMTSSPIKRSFEGAQKLLKNPIDQFNLSLYQNTTWGKETQNSNAAYSKLITNKAIDKDLKMTIGNKDKRPRERKFYSEGTTLPSIRSQRVLYQM